jgi:hypothetical protein
MLYEDSNGSSDNSMPLINQIQIWFHSLYCYACAEKIEHFTACQKIMHNDFFPLSPGLEDTIMAKISAEEEFNGQEAYATPGGLSTRGWIIAGIMIIISLATAFFNIDFQKIANESGISFLLPVGIIIGIVLTTYCALFIGSHLKELSERFGL